MSLVISCSSTRLRAQVEGVERARPDVGRQRVEVAERQVGQREGQVGQAEDAAGSASKRSPPSAVTLVKSTQTSAELDQADQQRAGQVEREAGPVGALRADARGEHGAVRRSVAQRGARGSSATLHLQLAAARAGEHTGRRPRPRPARPAARSSAGRRRRRRPGPDRTSIGYIMIDGNGVAVGQRAAASAGTARPARRGPPRKPERPCRAICRPAGLDQPEAGDGDGVDRQQKEMTMPSDHADRAEQVGHAGRRHRDARPSAAPSSTEGSAAGDEREQRPGRGPSARCRLQVDGPQEVDRDLAVLTRSPRSVRPFRLTAPSSPWESQT